MSRRLLTGVGMCWRMYNKHYSLGQTRCLKANHWNIPRIPAAKSLSQAAENSGHFDDNISLDHDEVDVDGMVRNLINYDTSDPIISSMLNVTTVQDLLHIIDEQADHLKKSYQVQAVLMLWYLQNVYVKVQAQLDNLSDDTENLYLEQLRQHPQFLLLLDRINNSAGEYNGHELSCTLLYLSKMNIDMKSDTMQSLILNVEKKFKDDPSSTSLTNLSRCCVAFKHNHELIGQFFLLGLVPHIEKHMEYSLSPDDLKLLTTCLLHTHQIITDSVLNKFIKICEDSCDNGVLTSEHGKIVIKILTVVSLAFWANRHGDLVRKLCKILENNVKNLEAKEIVSLSKIIQTHLEPAGLLEEVSEAAKECLGSSSIIPDKKIYVGLLTAAAQLSFASKKAELEKMLFKELDNNNLSYSLVGFFQILRSIKTSDHKLCHLYWTKVLELLRKDVEHDEPMKLLRVAHRYMYFNNNMGGTFRNFPFERQMIAWILDEMQFGSFSFVPGKLARGAAFVVAYSRDPLQVVGVIDSVVKVSSQLSKIDCVVLSRGVEIMLELARRKPLLSEAMEKLVELDTAMNKCAWRHLKNDNLGISDVTTLLRTFFNRRASPDSLLFDTIINKLKEVKENLNSRLVRDLSFCLSGVNYLLPALLEQMADYVVKNENTILAEAAERVLTTAYTLGYTPLCSNEFLNACSRLLQRDKDRLPSLVIIQTCLGLSFFHAFPPDLVNSVFSVDFLERIDEELASCYSKATYPVKVRYTLMELNRSVCLDLPQYDIPWFHSKYCEELATLDPKLSTCFHEEVRKQLVNVVGDANLIQTGVYSPYGYKINFLVLLDANTKPLLRSEENKAKSRVAFLLHSDCQFTLGDRRLKGPQQMRQRHLEMLDYRVVSIPEFVWNAMYLTEAHAKRSFLAQNLWPER